MPRSVALKLLGFANTGCHSHQMLMRQIGQELAGRGHHFAMLVSDVDEVGEEALDGVSGIQTTRFSGPPHLGTQDCAAKLPQDPVEVCLKSAHSGKKCLLEKPQQNQDTPAPSICCSWTAADTAIAPDKGFQKCRV